MIFTIVSVLLIVVAIMHGGWYLLCLWPATSFGVVAAGYLFAGPAVFGKSQSGILSAFHMLLLLPYLIPLWSVWSILRWIQSESPYDRLTDTVFIGRRLLGHELPESIDHVIDLTCEFNEPQSLRSANYHSMQILDGFVPNSQQLKIWVAEVAALQGTVYIHCAEGHGRTGLFAAALLVQVGQSESVADALQFIQSKRPGVRLSSRQLQTLTATHSVQ